MSAGPRQDCSHFCSLFPVCGKGLAWNCPDSVNLDLVLKQISNSPMFKILLLLKHYSSLKESALTLRNVCLCLCVCVCVCVWVAMNECIFSVEGPITNELWFLPSHQNFSWIWLLNYLAMFWVSILTPLLLTSFLSVSSSTAGVSNLLASLDHTGRRRVVLGHTLNTLQHIVTHKKYHNVLSKFMILCWASFTAILGCMQPCSPQASSWTPLPMVH